MTPSVDVPRLTQPAEVDGLPAGEGLGWWWGQGVLYVRTPSGALGGLRLHAIAADGTVTPSIRVCVGDGAGGWREDWHVMGRLLGWTPEDTARYGR